MDKKHTVETIKEETILFLLTPPPPRAPINRLEGQCEERQTKRRMTLVAREVAGYKAERRDAGVAFAIRNDIVGRLPCLPQGINNRLMNLRLPLQGGKFANIVSTYTPSMASPATARNKFYEGLNAVLAIVPKADELSVLGDLNARVATDHATWRGEVSTSPMTIACPSNEHTQNTVSS
nr:unnamed protein product [Spirometra erinaceieuropaei]